MNKMRMNLLVALMSIAFCAKCETRVDVSVGSQKSEWGALMGSRCDIYSGYPGCVGPLWLPKSGSVVVGSANLQSGLLGADICMSLEAVDAKSTGLSHRIKVKSEGILPPQKTASGGTVGRVIGCADMFIDAVANGVDQIPEFLCLGIEKYCRPHGKSMEYFARAHMNSISGCRGIRACFVCEDGWVVILFGAVGQSDVNAVECEIRGEKLVKAKGSCAVKVATGPKIEIALDKDEKCAVGMLCNESTGEVRVTFCGKAFTGFPDAKISPAEIERFMQDMKRYMDIKKKKEVAPSTTT